jgi:hypothetical protein
MRQKIVKSFMGNWILLNVLKNLAEHGREGSAFRERVSSRLLEAAADIAGVAVREI